MEPKSKIKTISLNFDIEFQTLEDLHDGLAEAMEIISEHQDKVSEMIEVKRRDQQFHDYLRGPFKFN